MERLVSLPLEVWGMVIYYLDNQSQSNLRLTNKYSAKIVAPYYFRTIKFNFLEESSIENLIRIAFHDELRKCVKTIILRRSYGLRDFEDIDSMVHRYDFEDNPLKYYFHHDENVMSVEECLALSPDVKKELYAEYRKDHLRLKEQARQVAKSCYFRSFGCKICVDFLQTGAKSKEDNSINDLLKKFDQALLGFENLYEFKHEPAHLHEDAWARRWRQVPITLDSIIDSTDDTEDEDVEALQLSIALRALGWANYFNCKLRSLKIFIGGPAFWGAERLHWLWHGHDELAKRPKYEYAWMREFEEKMEIPRLELYRCQEQISLMKQALVGLTQLDCTIGIEEEFDDERLFVLEMLYDFLRRGEAIEHLLLCVGSLVDGHLIQDDFNSRADRLLSRLICCKPWSKLRYLKLELITGEDTLVAFLSSLSGTLRRLSLYGMTIPRHGGSTESMLIKIGSVLELDELELTRLCDFNPEERVVLDQEASVWKNNDTVINCFEHYKNSVTEAVLTHASYLPPLDPDLFLVEHRRHCF